MDSPNVPESTLRVLASLLVLAFDYARENATHALVRLKPLVEPPSDLRVSSRVGALYSGLVVLDRGEIIAGIIVQTGQGIPTPALVTAPPVRTPASTSTSTYGSRFGANSERLPGWAEDPRSLLDDEDEPWRR